MTLRPASPTIARPLPAVVADPLPVQHTRVIACDRCGTWTPHSLNRSQTAYVCSCGEQIEYHINAGRHLWAA